ncbi:hypothetical protein AZE42_10438 [Rhizopogon vesiculosus]|uniref:Uncharacterized protein n=1 Tax=Rhizopogon vesiculosus TaxID=180088 RepID=A0A1J8QAH7_9AGAM|nr:hypothetical protein AZE42_10438 [Rhizopogon vesiculosus]
MNILGLESAQDVVKAQVIFARETHGGLGGAVDEEN